MNGQTVSFGKAKGALGCKVLSHCRHDTNLVLGSALMLPQGTKRQTSNSKFNEV